MSGTTTVDRLVELGFSQYEARAYLGLLGSPPMTGYALSNSTGIPQPKVYETLRRLARKGIAISLDGEPLRFVAVPPSQVLAQLDNTFRRRLADAEVGLMKEAEESAGSVRVYQGMGDWDAIEAGAVELLGSASRHVYVSINCDADAIVEAIVEADRRGVATDVLHFGQEPVTVEHGRWLRHSTTDGVVYRHHQARHLAVVADGSRVLWALAPDGRQWDAVTADDALLAAAVKGYIRHDIYVQQMARDFGDVLEARYGPALERLVVPSGADGSGAATKPARSRGRRRNQTA